MPLYEYECEACKHRFEIIQKFSDGPPDACPSCGKGPLQRLLSSPAIQFKGSGWYVTDYASKGKGGAESKSADKSGEGSSPTADAGTASESKKSEPTASAPAPSKD